MKFPTKQFDLFRTRVENALRVRGLNLLSGSRAFKVPIGLN